jgi:hypothetical protein
MFPLTQGWRQNTPPTLGSVMQPLRGRYFCKKHAALGVSPAKLLESMLLSLFVPALYRRIFYRLKDSGAGLPV